MMKTIFAAALVLGLAACGTATHQANMMAPSGPFPGNDAAAHHTSWGSANIPVTKSLTYGPGLSGAGGGGG